MCQEILEEVQISRRLRGSGPNPASIRGGDRCRQLQRPRALKRRLQKDRQLETIGLFSPLPSALHAGWAGPEDGIAMGQNAHPPKVHFLSPFITLPSHPPPLPPPT